MPVVCRQILAFCALVFILGKYNIICQKFINDVCFEFEAKKKTRKKKKTNADDTGKSIINE